MRMPDVKKAVLMLVALCALSLTAPAVKADEIVIGDRAGTGAGTTSPFGLSNVSYQAGGRYQQIYSRGAFPNRPITITQIAFASAFGPGGSPGIASYNFTVGLSTTASTTSAPSTVFNGNVGADFRTVFSGSLTAVLTQTGAFDLVITLDTPFTYNPGDGNLLFDVTLNSTTTFTAGHLGFVCGCRLDNVGPSDVARIFNQSGSVVGSTDAQPVGLLTRFTFAEPVPEPATLLLLVTGLAGAGAAVRKRRQPKVAR